MFQRRVLVVDDHPMVRALVAEKLTSHGYEVRTADSAKAAREAAQEFDPDVAVLDVELGAGPSGFDVATILGKLHPGIGLVFLTHLAEPKLMGLGAGVVGKTAAYILKDRLENPQLLIDAIEAALRERVPANLRNDKSPSHALTELSKGQLAAMRLMALGYSNSEIAKQRGTSERAVRNLLQRAFESAGIEDRDDHNQRVEAARLFIKVAGMHTNHRRGAQE